MPVEGQWRRLQTPLGRRDRRVLVVVACVAVAVALALGIAYATSSGSPPQAGCLVVSVPSTMGGATLRHCGPAAHDFCRTQGPLDRIVADACREQGFAADVPEP